MRRNVAPAFNHKTIQECLPSISLVTSRMVRTIKAEAAKNPTGQAVLNKAVIEKFAFDTVALISCGLDANTVSEMTDAKEGNAALTAKLKAPVSHAMDELFWFLNRCVMYSLPTVPFARFLFVIVTSNSGSLLPEIAQPTATGTPSSKSRKRSSTKPVRPKKKSPPRTERYFARSSAPRTRPPTETKCPTSKSSETPPVL